MNVLKNRAELATSDATAHSDQRSLWTLSALSDFALAAPFYGAWIQPHLFPPESLRVMSLTWGFEMLVLVTVARMARVTHAVSHRVLRGGCFVIVAGWAAVFVFLMSKVSGNWWYLQGFISLVINRSIPLLRGGGGKADRQFKVGAVLAAVSFTLCSFLAFGGTLPRLGVTDQTAKLMRISPPSAAHETIAFGAFYFTAMGICGLITPILANRLASVSRSGRPRVARGPSPR